MAQRVVGHEQGARRSVRWVATGAAVALSATAIVAAGGGPAAAADLPNAQSVGRFVDGSAGGMPIEALADVKDARAKAPGTTSAQNPLDVTLFKQLNIPLTNVISIPTQPAADAGVVNQVAIANANGKSLGAAGAVADDGGASLGDDNDGEPDAAKINLTGAALGSVSVPGLPGADALDGAALGGITGSIHGIYSRVATARGGEIDTPSSGIAGLTLTLGSPVLGKVLTQLQTAFSTSGIKSLLGTLGVVLGSTCKLAPTDPEPIELDGGVTLDAADASITLDVQKLIAKVLKKDISDLSTSNFDLVSFLIENLPDILATGVGDLLTSVTTELANQFRACTGTGPLSTVIENLLKGQDTLYSALKAITAPLASAGASGFKALATGLRSVLDIGLNVQSGPGIQPREKTYPYESNLDATPDQDTPVVEDQTLVRAIEINVLDAGSIPSLPGTNSGRVTQLAGHAAARPLALAPGGGVLNIALANSAAGPSDVSPDAVASTTASSGPVNNGTNIPTGIPAGQASGTHDGGLPVLSLVAILALLAVTGGAAWQLRQRGLRQH